MDTLALLCNLHADGPATLQRLRRSGCESLASLRRLDASTLAQRLDWNERAAERFLREAALLSERVEDELPAVREAELERAERSEDELEDEELSEDDEDADEEESAEEFELESTVVAELAGDPSAGLEDDEAFDEAEDDDEQDESEEDDAAGYAPPAERVQAVLGAWRELDRVAPPTDPDDFEIPRPLREAQPDRALAALELEGLSPRLASRLAELGIHSLRELVAARELDLARAVPLGFTRLKHLQFLAARALETLPVSTSAPLVDATAPSASPRVFQTFVPPPSEPFETAGPFA